MADVTKRSFGTETKPSTRSCEESIGFWLDRLEKAMEKQKETFDKFFKTVMASLSNSRLSIAEVCEDARVALSQFQETKVLPIHEIAMVKCDSVLQQPEDVSDSVSDEEQVLEADSSILEIEETKTVPYEATILKEPLLLDNSQEPQVLQSLLEPSHRICNKTREILKELQYVDVRKDKLQGCCDCGIGKIDAVQMFDQMSSGITSIEKPLKSVKNWKFKFKDGYEKEGIQVYSSVRCDSLNECWLIFGIEKLCKEEVQKNDWKSMEEKMLVRELLCLLPSNKDPSKSPMNAKSLAVIELLLGQMVMESKESMKQRETSSQVYKNMQEIFIKMDKSTLAQTLVRELQDLKETIMKKINYERDNKEENGFDTEKDRVASLAVRVQEHRVSNLLQLLQVGEAVRVMPAIKLIPTWGYFAYRAINSIIGNRLFKLTVPLLVPPSKRFKVVEESHTYFLEKGSYKSTARVTLLQVFNLGICYKVTWIPLAAIMFQVPFFFLVAMGEYLLLKLLKPAPLHELDASGCEIPETRRNPLFEFYFGNTTVFGVSMLTGINEVSAQVLTSSDSVGIVWVLYGWHVWRIMIMKKGKRGKDWWFKYKSVKLVEYHSNESCGQDSLGRKRFDTRN